jgi:hypothetical protein
MDPRSPQSVLQALRALTRQRLRGEVTDDEYEARVRDLEDRAGAAGLKIGIGIDSFTVRRRDEPSGE